MRFISNKEEIYKALSLAEGVVSSKSTIPILSNVLLETLDNCVEVVSTDLEVGLKTCFKASIEREGSITIAAKRLYGIIRELPNDDIIFDMDVNNRVKIESANPSLKASFTLIGIDKENFPKLPNVDKERFFSFEQGILKRMIRKTIFSVGIDETRYFLNGICFEKDEGIIKMIATDGRRLAFIKRDFDRPVEEWKNVIIPYKAMSKILSILKDEGLCRIALFENKIFFDFDGVRITSNLIEGRFPNYEQVIPKTKEREFSIKKDHLFSAIRRVSLMADERNNQISFSIGPNILSVFSQHPDLGGAKEDIEIDYKDEKFDVAFNYRYLMDALKEVDGDMVSFEMTTPDKPFVLKDHADIDYAYIIVPMKV